MINIYKTYFRFGHIGSSCSKNRNGSSLNPLCFLGFLLGGGLKVKKKEVNKLLM